LAAGLALASCEKDPCNLKDGGKCQVRYDAVGIPKGQPRRCDTYGPANCALKLHYNQLSALGQDPEPNSTVNCDCQ
jgi:hypothetical protein